MESYTATTEIIKILKEKEISLFSLGDFSRLFKIDKENTVYKKIQRLEKKGIVKKIIKGKYLFLFGKTNDFSLANFLYQPSYISLESALSFYGIITGFSYQITSVTLKKARIISFDNKEYSYSKIKNDLFWGYEKKDRFLMAEKEKSFLDYLYFYTKGLRNLDLREIDIDQFNKKKLKSYALKFKNQKILEVLKSIL